MKIVADDKIPYIHGVFEPYAEVVYLSGRAVTPADIADADALLVRTRTRCDAALLNGSRVNLVATATIGMDHIDADWCSGSGIEVVSAPGCNSAGVLQWVAAVLDYISSKKGLTPSATTIGVVGVGNVGSLVGSYAESWGFNVLCSDPPREIAEKLGRKDGFVPLAELAAKSDIVTFHVPFRRDGEYATCGLGGEEFFAGLKRGSVVLNSSRGGVVDERLLLNGIMSGACDGCIDTWEGEPAINTELLSRVLLSTPHIAGYSVQGKANASAMIVNAVARRFGLPLEGWYPPQVMPVVRAEISWEDMRASMKGRFNIKQESILLKDNPDDFEKFREEYRFREEYF